MNDRRPAYLVGMAVLAAAFVGYFAGVRGTARDVDALRARGVASQAGVAAVAPRSYADMRNRRYGDNAAAATAAFRALLDTTPPPSSSAGVEASPEEKAAALAARAQRRAFDGAPPTIPHRIDQRKTPDCLACHEKGLSVATLRAPAMSHQRLDSCTQCHVVAVDPRLARDTPADPENVFVGRRSPSSGERAWPGAPPTIPHTTLMRGTCMSCHGPQGSAALRTPHPNRQSCQQCHAPSATLDQRGAP